MEEQGEGSLVLGIMLKEVLGEDLLNGFGILIIEATIGHGAGSTPDILDGWHWDLPHSRMRLGWTGFDGTAMWDLVIQGVGPARGGGGHGAVVVQAVPVQSPEHRVAADLKEGGTHALDVIGVDPGISDKHFSHANHFIGPLGLAESGSMGVSDCMGSHLVSISIEVLDLRIVGPFVGDVEGGLLEQLDYGLILDQCH